MKITITWISYINNFFLNISDQNNPEDDLDLNGEVWVETKADGGKSYFYNARTSETTWTRPEEKEGTIILEW